MIPLRLFIILALFSRSESTKGSSSVLSRIGRGADCRRFNVELDGTQEVPSLDVPGTCQALLRLNAKKDKIAYVIRCKQLSRQPAASHIHQGAIGENGGIAVPLALTGSKRRVSKNFTTAADIGNDKFEELVKLMYEEKAYINIQTSTYSSGEVRGQIIPPPNCFKAEEEEEEKEDICLLPAVTGPCRGRFPRWYYNDEKGGCSKFVYGGCRGNENNFRTEDACKRVCPTRKEKEEEEENVCLLPAVTGRCMAYFPRWYYDNESEECSEFIYGGCGGNGNNFETEDDCKRVCPKIEENEEEEEEEENVCLLPAVTGRCKGHFQRWYYNESEECSEFIYGGCGGNGNNFETKDRCESTCLLGR